MGAGLVEARPQWVQVCMFCVLLGSVKVAASCMKRLLTTGSGGGLVLTHHNQGNYQCDYRGNMCCTGEAD